MDRLTARDPAFARRLQKLVRGEVREREPLGRYSTYRIGGPATVLLPTVPEDVGAALRLAHEAGIPWFAIGLGSNLLLPDDGMDALVIRLGKGLDRLTREGDRVTLGAGLPAPHAARRTAEAGYAGLHIFVGVPGTVGGGVYMSAGCHGGDWAEVVESVTVMRRCTGGGGKGRRSTNRAAAACSRIRAARAGSAPMGRAPRAS
jgi:UDP-N-acetylmuramate dehydrogenase